MLFENTHSIYTVYHKVHKEPEINCSKILQSLYEGRDWECARIPLFLQKTH